MNIAILLFPGFETLDVFGPVEVLSFMEDVKLYFLSVDGGLVRSTQGVEVMTIKAELCALSDVLLVPGGYGARDLVTHRDFLELIRELSKVSRYVLSVCTGSALLAAAGVLDGRRATSNKRAWEWATSQSELVTWVRRARWVEDGSFFTSSGVSAGMDMALAFIARVEGGEKAEEIAHRIEYSWQRDSELDPFA